MCEITGPRIRAAFKPVQRGYKKLAALDVISLGQYPIRYYPCAWLGEKEQLRCLREDDLQVL